MRLPFVPLQLIVFFSIVSFCACSKKRELSSHDLMITRGLGLYFRDSVSHQPLVGKDRELDPVMPAPYISVLTDDQYHRYRL